MKKILYISYDGLTDALGQSQVLAYLKRFDRTKYVVHIISFEKKEVYHKHEQYVRNQINEAGLIWHQLYYTRKPPVFSTLFDIVKGVVAGLRLVKKERIDVVHCRGYIAAYIGAFLKKRTKVRFIFDMRGWWPDEKKESGLWNGPMYHYIYKFFKSLEKDLFNKADFIVSLTESGKKEIVQAFKVPEAKVGVVSTCVDLDVFKEFDEAIRSQIRQELGIDHSAKVVIYSGALGGNYDIQILFDLYKEIQTFYGNTFLLILSKESLEVSVFKKNIPDSKFAIRSVAYHEVHKYLIASDLGIVFYSEGYSQMGRCPTKLGEYWACGLPVISFKGVGDLDLLYHKYPEGGVLLQKGETRDLKQKLSLPLFSNPNKNKLRAYAHEYFGIQTGILFYQNVYKLLN